MGGFWKSGSGPPGVVRKNVWPGPSGATPGPLLRSDAGPLGHRWPLPGPAAVSAGQGALMLPPHAPHVGPPCLGAVTAKGRGSALLAAQQDMCLAPDTNPLPPESPTSAPLPIFPGRPELECLLEEAAHCNSVCRTLCVLVYGARWCHVFGRL